MEISSKRGIWYVTEPGRDVQKFDSEKAAIAYVKGYAIEEPDDDDYWDDDEE